MSNITSNPPLLDSTGLELAAELDKRNALLAMIAEEHRSGVYADLDQIASIVRNGYGAEAFPIGDQIIDTWTDVDSNTPYQVPMDIVQHGLYELENGDVVPGMAVQWHYCSPFGVQFSHQRAFLYCENGLAAGTYSLTLASTWGSTGAVAGSVWSFTLTQAVPAGGRLSGFEVMADTASTNWKVKSWANLTDTTPMETVNVVAGGGGTDLGMMPYTTPSATLNSMQQTGYGLNRWGYSAIRQYLNGSGLGWWKAQDNYDIRPDEFAKHGFLDGMSDALKRVTKPVKIVTAPNTVSGYTEDRETTYDRVFLPSLEQMNVQPQLLGVEGDTFEYWKRRAARTGFAPCYTAMDEYKIPAINAQTFPQYVRVRSAHRGGACSSWIVNTSGSVSYGYAYNAYRFSPVCVIC